MLHKSTDAVPCYIVSSKVAKKNHSQPVLHTLQWLSPFSCLCWLFWKKWEGINMVKWTINNSVMRTVNYLTQYILLCKDRCTQYSSDNRCVTRWKYNLMVLSHRRLKQTIILMMMQQTDHLLVLWNFAYSYFLNLYHIKLHVTVTSFASN